MERSEKLATLAIGLAGVALIVTGVTMLLVTDGDNRNGCTPAEAHIELNGRDTCYPSEFLPVELLSYLEVK